MQVPGWTVAAERCIKARIKPANGQLQPRTMGCSEEWRAEACMVVLTGRVKLHTAKVYAESHPV